MGSRRNKGTSVDPEDIGVIGATAQSRQPPAKSKFNASQTSALELLDAKPIVVLSGCAGTGKSYVALAWASEMLRTHKVDKIAFVRSPLEMGRSKIGYIPGTTSEKMAPYTGPIFAIAKKLGLPEGIISCHPLCHVQGMTFERTVVIVDEVQNMDIDEFRAIVTRLGIGSSMILCGDPEQDTRNIGGFPRFIEAVKCLNCVGIQYFTESDNMRHPAIAQVLRALKSLN